ncbi:MAG: MMPL family transporter [Deltaproteobacteria bacterium]|nr:MMPL family transporter [Deltaproteobacteria bacterium]
MKKIREWVEDLFESYAKLVIRFHWLVLVMILVVVGFSVYQFRNLKFDTSTESFFHEEDPVLIGYNDFRDQFGRDEVIGIMIKPKEVFNLEFLRKLQALHDELEEKVPYLNDITSLVNARLTKGAEGQLIVQDLLEDFPETREQLDELKNKVMNHPLYKNLMISEDGTYTVILIKTEAFSSLDHDGKPFEAGAGFSGLSDATGKKAVSRPVITDEENSLVIKAVREVISRYQGEDFEISFSGTPVVTDFLKKSMQRDMRKFTLLAILAIGVFLLLLFRRSSGVLLPLLTVIFSVIITIGFMSVLGVSLKMPTMILPSFLLAVSVGATVHLMSIFYKDFAKHNKDEAIIEALRHSGLPIIMTSLTTAAGLASFSRAEIAPIGDLGLFGSFGVMVSMLLTLTLIPAFLSFMRVRPVKSAMPGNRQSFVLRFLLWCGDLATGKPWWVFLLSIAFVVISAAGISRLQFSHNTLKWFPKSSEIRKQTDLMDNHMKGSVAMEILIDTGKENGLYEPEVMEKIDLFSKELKTYKTGDSTPLIGKTVGISDMLKEINQALNENKPEHYSIPKDKRLIAQEFLLFENSGSDDLEDIVDSRFSKTRLSAKGPWKDATTYVDFVDFVNEKSSELFGEKIKVSATGMIVLFTETIYAMMNSTLVSYSIAGVVITILMIILIGKLKLGLLSMIPNLSPIIMTMGVMGWLGFPLDMFTLLIGSISIGLAVDDTIHFFYNYRKYYEETHDAKEAVRRTLSSAGRAMMVTSIVLTLGFWLFMFASLNNLFNFGLLTGLSMVLAFFADILMAPAMLTLLSRSENK